MTTNLHASIAEAAMNAANRNAAYRRGYSDGYHNRANQAEIAGDDWRDTLPRRDYSAGYSAGVIAADHDHAAKSERVS